VESLLRQDSFISRLSGLVGAGPPLWRLSVSFSLALSGLEDSASPDGSDDDEVSTTNRDALGSWHSIIMKLMADEIPGLRAISMTELRFPAAVLDGEDFGCFLEEPAVVGPENEGDGCGRGVGEVTR